MKLYMTDIRLCEISLPRGNTHSWQAQSDFGTTADVNIATDTIHFKRAKEILREYLSWGVTSFHRRKHILSSVLAKSLSFPVKNYRRIHLRKEQQRRNHDDRMGY
jgi:hypothetical protein